MRFHQAEKQFACNAEIWHYSLQLQFWPLVSKKAIVGTCSVLCALVTFCHSTLFWKLISPFTVKSSNSLVSLRWARGRSICFPCTHWLDHWLLSLERKHRAQCTIASSKKTLLALYWLQSFRKLVSEQGTHTQNFKNYTILSVQMVLYNLNING